MRITLSNNNIVNYFLYTLAVIIALTQIKNINKKYMH